MINAFIKGVCIIYSNDTCEIHLTRMTETWSGNSRERGSGSTIWKMDARCPLHSTWFRVQNISGPSLRGCAKSVQILWMNRQYKWHISIMWVWGYKNFILVYKRLIKKKTIYTVFEKKMFQLPFQMAYIYH